MGCGGAAPCVVPERASARHFLAALLSAAALDATASLQSCLQASTASLARRVDASAVRVPFTMDGRSLEDCVKGACTFLAFSQSAPASWSNSPILCHPSLLSAIQSFFSHPELLFVILSFAQRSEEHT